MGACLDDDQVLALLEGRADAASLLELDAHIDACAPCRSLVTAVARGRGDRDDDRIGRYVVVGALGQGSFGRVLRAYDPALDRRVAIKVLDRGEGLLEAEARAMAKLSHPHVVTVYEVGQHDGETFLAMELVEGPTLRTWLDGDRSWEAVRDVFVQAGRGLAAAHAAGLVHGDFKPENVLIADGRARVTDFGLAHAPAGWEDEAAELEVSAVVRGRLVGTPAYMAPEQLSGAEADPRSDQYAFAVALFEALEGHRPFSATTVEALVAEAPTREPPKLARAPGWLGAVVRRALASDPTTRYESMGALLDALSHDPWIRRRQGAGVAFAATVAVALGVAIAGEPEPCSGGDRLADEVWNDEREARIDSAFTKAAPSLAGGATRVVVAAFDDWRRRWTGSYRGLCLAARDGGRAGTPCLMRQRAEVDALVTAFGAADKEAVALAVEGVGALPDPATCEQEDDPQSPAQRERLAGFDELLARAKAALATGRYLEARSLAEQLNATAQGADHHPSEARSWLLAAEARWRLAEDEQATRHTQEATYAATRAGDDVLLAEAWLLRLAVAGTSGDHAVAAEAARHAEAFVERTGSTPLRARLLNARGVLATNQGDFERAERDLREALELRELELGADHVDVAKIHTNLGNLARSRGDLSGARHHHERAQAIDEAALGSSHPRLATHLHNLARITLLEGDPSRAEGLYLRALKLRRDALGSAHPEVGLTHNSLGLLFARLDRHDDARRHYQLALERVTGRPRLEAVVRKNLAALPNEEPPPPKAPPPPASPSVVAPKPVRPPAPSPRAPRPPPPTIYLPGQDWD